MNELSDDIDINDFIKIINTNDNLIVLDFYAKWCRPCKILTPYLNQLAKINKDVFFYKIDIDKYSEIGYQFNIKSMPTLIFLKKRKILDKMEGGSLKILQNVYDNYFELDSIEGLELSKINSNIIKFKSDNS